MEIKIGVRKSGRGAQRGKMARKRGGAGQQLYSNYG